MFKQYRRRFFAVLVAALVALPSVAEAANTASAPPQNDSCTDLAQTSNASYGVKLTYFNSAYSNGSSSLMNGTNVCNDSDATNLSRSEVAKGATARANGATITFTIVGNTDRDNQTTNNLALSAERAKAGRWYVEQAMLLKYGSLPDPSVTTTSYKVFTYDYPTGGNVVIRTQAASDSNATGTTTAAKRLDRNATLKVEIGPPPTTTTTSTTSTTSPTTSTTTPPLPPVLANDSFAYLYGSAYRGDLTTNDRWNSSSCSYSAASQPASGSVAVNTNGRFEFYPGSQYFTGTVTFLKKCTNGFGLSDTASVSVAVTPPSAPEPPIVTATTRLTAPTWARLNTSETFSATRTLKCEASATLVGSRCTIDRGLVGSYTEVLSVQVTSMTLTPPIGYPSSRFTPAPNLTGRVLPTSGTLRFSQATTAGKPFRLSVTTMASIRQVKWYRNSAGEMVVDSSTLSTSYIPASTTSIGVVGSTR